jgi:hypothetical protein
VGVNFYHYSLGFSGLGLIIEKLILILVEFSSESTKEMVLKFFYRVWTFLVFFLFNCYWQLIRIGLLDLVFAIVAF